VRDRACAIVRVRASVRARASICVCVSAVACPPSRRRAQGIEVVLFNVLLACADFLVDVQNELLAKCRSMWRSLGFVYLCALINNCRRCAELWEKVLDDCRGADERSPLSEGLASNLHLGFVSDGFVNLGFAAMQLAAQRVLVQLERPLAALFAAGNAKHHPTEMAAVVEHFLKMVCDGVAGVHATRTCAICTRRPGARTRRRRRNGARGRATGHPTPAFGNACQKDDATPDGAPCRLWQASSTCCCATA
jgi:hypothetical protein